MGSFLQQRNHILTDNPTRVVVKVVVTATPVATPTTTVAATPTAAPVLSSSHLPKTAHWTLPVTQYSIPEMKVGEQCYADYSDLVIERDHSVYLNGSATCPLNLQYPGLPNVITVTQTKKGYEVDLMGPNGIFDTSQASVDNGHYTNLLPIAQLNVSPVP